MRQMLVPLIEYYMDKQSFHENAIKARYYLEKYLEEGDRIRTLPILAYLAMRKKNSLVTHDDLRSALDIVLENKM